MQRHGHCLAEAIGVRQAIALTGGPRAWPTERRRTLWRDEALCSLAMAGIALDGPGLTALAAGTVPGGMTLDRCNTAADYLAAARHVRALPPAGRRPFLRVDEIVALHTLAVRRTAPQATTWRPGTAGTLPSGAIPPPAWLVARDMAAFVERMQSGPGEREPYLWVAEALDRLVRIHPFQTANGRVARLVANLLLRRLDLPPMILRRRDRARYAAALARAAAADVWPLTQLLVANARVTLRSVVERTEQPRADLLALRDLADTRQRNALYKAAERGRLRIVRDGPAVYSTRAWIQEYLTGKSRAGRPPIRPLSEDYS